MHRPAGGQWGSGNLQQIGLKQVTRNKSSIAPAHGLQGTALCEAGGGQDAACWPLWAQPHHQLCSQQPGWKCHRGLWGVVGVSQSRTSIPRLH